jgi:hypothetical protein
MFAAAKEERSRNSWSRLKALFVPGIPELFARVVALNAKVEGLAQLSYPVTNIFVTFETEKDQRRVLNLLSVGAISASRNDIDAVSASFCSEANTSWMRRSQTNRTRLGGKTLMLASGKSSRNAA